MTAVIDILGAFLSHSMWPCSQEYHIKRTRLGECNPCCPAFSRQQETLLHCTVPLDGLMMTAGCITCIQGQAYRLNSSFVCCFRKLAAMAMTQVILPWVISGKHLWLLGSWTTQLKFCCIALNCIQHQGHKMRVNYRLAVVRFFLHIEHSSVSCKCKCVMIKHHS